MKLTDLVPAALRPASQRSTYDRLPQADEETPRPPGSPGGEFIPLTARGMPAGRNPNRADAHRLQQRTGDPSTAHDARAAAPGDRPAARDSGSAEAGLRGDPPVRAGDFSPRRALASAGRTAGKAGLAGASIAATYYTIQAFQRGTTEAVPGDAGLAPGAGMVAGGAAAMMLASNMFTPVYEAYHKFFTGLADAVFKDGLITRVQAMQGQYQKDKAALEGTLADKSAAIRDAVRDVDNILGELFASAEKGDKVDTVRIESLARWRVELLINAPSDKQVAWGALPSQRQALGSTLDHDLRLCGPKQRTVYKTLIMRIAANSAVPKSAQLETEQKRLQFCLVGPPGRGKSFFAKLAKRLTGLPLLEFTVPPERDGGLKALYGKPWNAIKVVGYNTRDDEAMGEMGLGLAHARCTNPIIYLNEINMREASVVDALKQLLDAENRKFKIPGFESWLDFSNATVIIDLNLGPGQKLDSAIADRVEVFDVDEEITPELAWHQALDEYEQQARAYCKPLVNGETILQPQQQKALEQAVMKALPALLAEHARTHGSARFPFVGTLTSFVATGLEENQPRTDEEILAFILAQYPPAADEEGGGPAAGTGKAAALATATQGAGTLG
jgi:hypothetical protein